MIKRLVYSVGQHLFLIDMPEGLFLETELEPYAPFSISLPADGTYLFSLEILPTPLYEQTEGSNLVSFNDENGRMELSTLHDGVWRMRLLSPKGRECCQLEISSDFRNARGWFSESPRERVYALDTTLMLLYACASARSDTLLLHASAIEYDGNGYLFLGKSGTGKSTHAHLWTDHIPGAKLLNDDNPVVRIIEGKPYVFGSPWSGKTPCHINKGIPVGAITRLKQVPYNQITRLSGPAAYASLLPSCSGMKWDTVMADQIHVTLIRLMESCRIFSLECRPDREALRICHESVTRIDSNSSAS